METSRTREKLFTTRDLTLSAALASFYIVSTFVPVDAFIGGAGFISLEIVAVPVMAAILRPPQAFVSIFVGSLGMAVFQTGPFSLFGFFALLVPTIATVLGSFAFHVRHGSVLAWAYVLFGALYYLAFSRGGTVLWLIPYMIVIASIPLALKARGTRSITILAFYTAMTWQVTLNILSIAILGLVGSAWIAITPFMFLERTIATLGSVAVIIALKSRLGASMGLDQELVKEVN